ncbi:MAG: hypothetical protein Fur005_19140 [Roseiflexaceae bacterium]
MTIKTAPHYVDSNLLNGFVQHWLLAGPLVRVIENLDQYQGSEYKYQVVRDRYQADPGLGEPPFELEPVHPDHPDLTWQLYRCREDHFVDLSGFYHLTSHLQAWAYCEIVAASSEEVQLALTTNAPADLWVNGVHVGRIEHFHHQIPQTVSFATHFTSGPNAVLVRFEAVAARECPYVMAMQVRGAPKWGVRLPTSVPHQALRAKIERLLDSAIVEQDVFCRDDELRVRWPDDLPADLYQTLTVRLQNDRGQIFMEGLPQAKAGHVQSLGYAIEYRDGNYRIVLMPHPDAYYLHNIRVKREIPITIQNRRYSASPYGSYAERRLEALLDAADRPNQIYGEIAKMELGMWDELNLQVVEETIDGINQRKDCSDFYLVGLLGALTRYGAQESFPDQLREQISSCALGFRYWASDPGADAMWFWSENHQILFHACEVLAGQLFAEQTFSNTGQSGAWHAARGQEFALAWLQKRAAGGFREWDSNCYFEHDVLALTHLADLAVSEDLRTMAVVILDKLFFTMALNSYRGVFGSTHGRTYTGHIKGGRQELTSGIGRMLWGLGVFNQHTLGTVALACATSYELPTVIEQIATAEVEELWSRERHRQELTWEYDRVDGVLEVNKVTYRTAAGMLCSAQDHLAGQAGSQQHIWQATLSQDAVVFVSHPPCISEENSHRPGFWHGHVTLPRVAQWYEMVIDIRNIPASDWLGFTHAYFPTYAFDRYLLRDGWAFAQVGDGCLAICASAPLTLITTGDNAYRELRAYGRQVVWICQLGTASKHGSFEAFQQQVLAQGLVFDRLSVHGRTLRGQEIRFSWEGPLLVDGIEQPLNNFKHYDSPLCRCELGADVMEIAGWDEAIRLDFTLE